ncbi:putative RNA methyltransferase lin1815 [Nymphon striatum]|nr:putative RNA methyltransferase lin1815 [Nymphon striatum]
MRRSDQTFAASSCSAAHPLLEELIVEGSFGDATEVTLRVGASSHERMVLTNGSRQSVQVPDDVQVVRADNPGDAAIHDELGGLRWRISANSFFQTSDSGAQALIDSVADGLVGAGSLGTVVDLYCGVGLLGGATAGDRLVAAVESNPSSVADAEHNLPADVDVHRARVEHWRPGSYDTVIADPARRGLAKGGTAVIDKTGATTLVLVSCDPASLGRDTALLAEQGWRYDRGEVIDMFPDTSRIEVVSTFTR